MARTRKLYIKTYGCQMNVYDSRRMADALAGEGFRPVDAPDDADMVILNTCHIREKAAEKVYSEIGRLRQIRTARAAAGENMYIAVAGCVAQAEGAEILRRAPAVDMVFGPQTYHRLPAMLREADALRAQGRKPRVMDTDFPAEDKFDFLPGEVAAPEGASAFLTVQEGCDKFCSFCVVPYTRGAEVSRPVEAVVAEARAMAGRGVREITLLGQNVNAYHGVTRTGGAADLAGLIADIAAISGIERIRYTTSHPCDMTDSLIAAHRDIPALMPYLHLPVQSGSDRILAAMNRRHDAAGYLALIERLRMARPDIAISGDFIVGFPGETEEDFQATLDIVAQVDYAQAYSFKYSPRPGTPASESDMHVPEQDKTDRLARLQDLLNSQQARFNAGAVGRTLPVLIERRGRKPSQVLGRSPYMQSVHVDLQDAALDGDAAQTYSLHLGGIYDIRIVEAGPKSLKGQPVDLQTRDSAAA